MTKERLQELEAAVEAIEAKELNEQTKQEANDLMNGLNWMLMEYEDTPFETPLRKLHFRMFALLW